MTCLSYVDGAWLEDPGAPVVELGNPADRRQTVSRSRHATPEQARRSVAAADNAWREWRRTSGEQRVSAIEELLAAIDENRLEFMRAISAETGKTANEARQEVDATLEEARIQIEECALEEAVGNNRIRYEALGAVLLVTPSNFPLAAVMRKLVPALLCGNTVIVKASELTPLTSCGLFGLIEQLGLPSGTANLILAEGRAVVPSMLAGEALQAVSLTGSNAAGDAIAAAVGPRDIRFQAEMGGSNVAVVLRDADLDLATTALVEHAFACCGQWCTGTSRVIVDAPVYDDVVQRLLDKTRRIVVGPAGDDTATMGPMISAAQRRLVEAAVAAAIASGVRLACGGKRPAGERFEHGFFFEPTLLVDVHDQSALCRQEIFGPVLAVVPSASIEDALVKSNEGTYGLSFSVYTADSGMAERFLREVDSGLCHVNLPTGHRHSAMPLAGWKASGRGLPECGRFARDFFTRTRAVYGLPRPRSLR